MCVLRLTEFIQTDQIYQTIKKVCCKSEKYTELNQKSEAESPREEKTIYGYFIVWWGGGGAKTRIATKICELKILILYRQ